jgi:hypothetical protein
MKRSLPLNFTLAGSLLSTVFSTTGEADIVILDIPGLTEDAWVIGTSTVHYRRSARSGLNRYILSFDASASANFGDRKCPLAGNPRKKIIMRLHPQNNDAGATKSFG